MKIYKEDVKVRNYEAFFCTELIEQELKIHMINPHIGVRNVSNLFQ